MNSRVSVDAEERVGGWEEAPQDLDTTLATRETVDHKGNVVLLLPHKDELAADSSTESDCVSLTVNDIPVYISHTSSGSPIYIRKYPPTLEEIMKESPEHVFDGFSEASGQTFEGFSEASCSSVPFEGFSEASSSSMVFEGFSEQRCDSVLFEGFSEEACGDSKAAVMQTLARIASKKVDDSVESDGDGSHSERASLGEPRGVHSRRSSSHRGRLVSQKNSSGRLECSRSDIVSRKVKQEAVTEAEDGKEKTAKGVSRRRSSLEKQVKQYNMAVGEQMGKAPRNLHLPSPGDPDYIGEYCNAVGCTVSFLERMGLKDVKVNNGVILELVDFAKKISWEKEYVVRWIQRLSGLRTDESLDDDDWRSIQAIVKRRKAISTIHSGNQCLKSKLEAFDKSEYVLPSITKRQVMVKNEETSDEAKNRQMTDNDEGERGETRRGVKRVLEAQENDTEDKVDVKKINLEEDAADRGKKVESSETRDKTGASKSEREPKNRRSRIKVEEEDTSAPNKENQESTDKATNEIKPEMRVLTRRSSLLASRGEKEAQPIKEVTDKVTEEVYTSRSGRRIKTLPRDDRKKQEEKTVDKKREKEGGEQEQKEREEEVHSNQAEGSVTTGRRTSSRRSSMLKAKEEKERASAEKDEVAEKTETGADEQRIERKEKEEETHSNQAGRRTSSRRSSMLKAREEKERTSAEKDEAGTDEQTTATENENAKERNQSNRNRTDATADEKNSNRREETFKRVKQEEQVTDMKTPTQTTTKSSIRTRRASLLVKQEEKQKENEGSAQRRSSRRGSILKESDASLKDATKEVASKPQKEVTQERRTTRRGSLLIAKQEEGRTPTTEETKKDESKKITADDGKDARSDETEEEKRIKPKEESQVSKEESATKENLTSPSLAEREDDADKTSSEDQFVLKRNKVINRDKRISRWQNKKMAQVEEHKASTIDSPAKGDIGGGEEPSQKEESYLDISKCDESLPSDNESGCDLVIDEGDENVQPDDGNSSLQSNLESEEDVLSPEDKKKIMIECKKEEVGEVVLGSKEPTPQFSVPVSSTETTPVSRERESAYAGTLGVSKSGRLRKPSAKGIQSIEIKCLFMQRNGEAPRPPPPLPTSKEDHKDKDWVEKRLPLKREPRDSEWMPEKRSPVKCEPQAGARTPNKKSPVKVKPGDKSSTVAQALNVRKKYHRRSLLEKMKEKKVKHFTRTDNEFLTYTYHDGHMVPKFRETDVYIGDYCSQAGLTVHDLNSEDGKVSKLNFGMIRELYQFYVSRKATKTALAIKLFKLRRMKLVDNTHLLSTVMRITNVARLKHCRWVPYDREFVLPVRLAPFNGCEKNISPPTTRDSRIKKPLEKSVPPPALPPPPPENSFPARVRRSPKKRGVKPEDSGDEYEYFGEEEERETFGDILVTRGQKGNITRGDIVHLYSKWLSSKMSEGSNTFVTDLLRNVEQLMAERQVAPLRIPAGTLMSSSVKLYDEFNQILSISKEDAIMYLQEDWLEDIQYLLSISGPSRRNTSEGEAAPGTTVEADTPVTTLEKPSKCRAPRRRSGGHKGGASSDYEGEPANNTSPFKGEVNEGSPRRHQMESVGKRSSKRKNIRESLDKFDKEILMELEKSGGLEEEEEDTLHQIDLEHSFEEDWEEEQEREEEKTRKRESRKLEKRDTSKVKKLPLKREPRDSEWVPESDTKKVIPVPKSIKSRDEFDFDCEVQKIVDYQEIHDSRGKHFRYLVRWVGCGPRDDSWVTEANLQCPEILKAFWKQKKSSRSGKPEGPSENRTKEETEPAEPYWLDPGSKDEDNIVQVMVKHAAAQGAAQTMDMPIVTNGELLGLYDAWRQENQNELMAGGTNTVNVEVFKDRVRALMTSRGLTFHPESLLNAAFMMTLMKTRLQNQMAVNKFLNTSCLEVLEASQKQYLRRKYSQVGESLAHARPREQKPSFTSLQKDLCDLKLDFATAQKWRAVKNSHLGAVEEEVDCLEAAAAMPEDERKEEEILLFLKQEVHKLKNDLKELERNQQPDPADNTSKTIRVPLFSNVVRDAKNYDTNSKMVRDKLLTTGMAKSTVDTIMGIVARRVVADQCVQE